MDERHDVDSNIITSAFGKGDNKIINWLNKGFAKYINKEKALHYLHLPAPIAGALSGKELVSAAKVVRDFNNAKLPNNDFDGDTQKRTSNAKNGTPEEGIVPASDSNNHAYPNPTKAQKKAGNYRKRHVKVDGFDISIENEKGSERRGTRSVDGDHIDVFLSDNPSEGDVYVID